MSASSFSKIRLEYFLSIRIIFFFNDQNRYAFHRSSRMRRAVDCASWDRLHLVHCHMKHMLLADFKIQRFFVFNDWSVVIENFFFSIFSIHWVYLILHSSLLFWNRDNWERYDSSFNKYDKWNWNNSRVFVFYYWCCFRVYHFFVRKKFLIVFVFLFLRFLLNLNLNSSKRFSNVVWTSNDFFLLFFNRQIKIKNSLFVINKIW